MLQQVQGISSQDELVMVAPGATGTGPPTSIRRGRTTSTLLLLLLTRLLLVCICMARACTAISVYRSLAC